MTKEQIIKKINVILAEEFEIPMELITPDADIRQTLGVDSMRALELMALIRKELGVKMAPYDLPKLVTFEDIYRFIYEHQSNKG